MRYTIAAALCLNALVGTSTAVTLHQKFTDDLLKSLAEDMQKDDAKPEAAAAPEAAKAAPQAAAQTEKHPSKKDSKKTKATKGKAAAKKAAPAKKEEKAEDTEIPMDAAAIKAYSSVIADAAEDSEPSAPVVYTKTIPDE